MPALLPGSSLRGWDIAVIYSDSRITKPFIPCGAYILVIIFNVQMFALLYNMSDQEFSCIFLIFKGTIF